MDSHDEYKENDNLLRQCKNIKFIFIFPLACECLQWMQKGVVESRQNSWPYCVYFQLHSRIWTMGWDWELSHMIIFVESHMLSFKTEVEMKKIYDQMVQSHCNTCLFCAQSKLQAFPYRYHINMCPIKKSDHTKLTYLMSTKDSYWDVLGRQIDSPHVKDCNICKKKAHGFFFLLDGWCGKELHWGLCKGIKLDMTIPSMVRVNIVASVNSTLWEDGGHISYIYI